MYVRTCPAALGKSRMLPGSCSTDAPVASIARKRQGPSAVCSCTKYLTYICSRASRIFTYVDHRRHMNCLGAMRPLSVFVLSRSGGAASAVLRCRQASLRNCQGNPSILTPLRQQRRQSLVVEHQRRQSSTMSPQPAHPTLLVPGPIEFDDAVLQSMSHYRYVRNMPFLRLPYSRLTSTARAMSGPTL